MTNNDYRDETLLEERNRYGREAADAAAREAKLRSVCVAFINEVDRVFGPGYLGPLAFRAEINEIRKALRYVGPGL